jgi:uncharacterized RDD family membrane protein YckC
MPSNPPTHVMGRRVGAAVIDGILLGATQLGVFFAMATKYDYDVSAAFFAKLRFGDTTYAITGGDAVLYFAIILVIGGLYYAVLPGLTGWTPGKLATGIRVVGPDGRAPAGVGRNVVRWLFLIVDDVPYFIPLLTGFIVALATEPRRRVGDMVAGTFVVRADAVGQPVTGGPPGALGAPPPPPPAPGAPPANWYPDPSGTARLRYWDGVRWTEHTND